MFFSNRTWNLVTGKSAYVTNIKEGMLLHIINLLLEPCFPLPCQLFWLYKLSFICLFPGTPAALQVKWSPAGDSYAVAIGTKVVVYKLAVSLLSL